MPKTNLQKVPIRKGITLIDIFKNYDLTKHNLKRKKEPLCIQKEISLDLQLDRIDSINQVIKETIVPHPDLVEFMI